MRRHWTANDKDDDDDDYNDNNDDKPEVERLDVR